MEAERITLDHYPDAEPSFHIHKVSGDCEAQRLHYHDYYQIYYVLGGTITHVLEGRERDLGRGDVFIIPPGRSHRIVMGGPGTAFYSFSFTGDFLEDGFFDTYPGRFLLFLQSAGSSVRPRIAVPADRQMPLNTMMETVMDEFTAKKPGEPMVIRGLLTAILTLLGREYFENAGREPDIEFENYRQSMLYCIEYIGANCTRDITLTEITRLAAMSRSNFCRLFRAFTGMSFRQYLHRQRIERALALIREGRCDINEVALRCGYTDYSTFYRNFVRYAASTPVQIRRAALPGRSP